MELAPTITLSDYSSGSVIFTPIMVSYEMTLPAVYNGVIHHVRQNNLMGRILSYVHRDLNDRSDIDALGVELLPDIMIVTIESTALTPGTLSAVADCILEHLNNVDLPTAA